MKRRGFTLVELLVTITIIAALAAIAYPVTIRMVAHSRQAACLGKLHDIGVGLELWLQDHNRTLPDLAAGRAAKTDDLHVLDNTLNIYLPNPEVFHCPADPKQFNASGCSYLWNSTQSNLPETKMSFFGIGKDPAQIPLVTDKESWHPDGSRVNILYADLSASRELHFRSTPK